MTVILFFLCLPSCLNATSYMLTSRPNIAVDIVAIATEELARNRKEVVFYFLARILKNEERESRKKKVKDTSLVSFLSHNNDSYASLHLKTKLNR